MNISTQPTHPHTQGRQPTQSLQSIQHRIQPCQSTQSLQFTQSCTEQLQPTQSFQTTQPCPQQFQPSQSFQFTQHCTQPYQSTQSLQLTQSCTQQLKPTQSFQFSQPCLQKLQPTQYLQSTQPQIHQLQPIQPLVHQSQRPQLCPTVQPPFNILTPEANLNVPSRPKPPPGVFAFGRLSFLDKKIARCYGCEELLKPGGNIPYPPEDMVVTTRLCRRYHDKDGQLKISPKVSSVYFHLNPNCVRAACPQFETKSCIVPSDLIPFMFVQHTNALSERFGL